MLNQSIVIEPITAITDILVSIETLIFIYYILKSKKKHNLKDRSLLSWIAAYFCIMLFSLFGAISHLQTKTELVDIFWPPTMIFGGISFIFVVFALILDVNPKQKEVFYSIPLVLFIGYIILAFISKWAFLTWVGLLVVCSILIYYLGFQLKLKKNLLGKYIILGNTVIIVAGLFQALGGMFFYGPGQEGIPLNTEGTAVFKPHNDGFHIIAGIALFIFFLGIRKQFFINQKIDFEKI